MTLFWISCAVLIVIAIVFIVYPLWRGAPKSNAVARDAANLEILRDQIAELDNDLKNGLLTPELHEQGKRELETRVLEEVGQAEAEAVPASHPYKVLAIVLAVLLPVVSFGVYYMVGEPNAMSPANPHAAMGGGMGGAMHTDSGIRDLEKRVEANDQDGEALVMLARSYMDAERYADSAKAFEKLSKLVPDEAWVWADYADAQAMAQGQTLRGKPTEFINKALKLDPNNMKGLALAGSAAMERGDFAIAITYWERLLKQLPPGGEDAAAIQSGLNEARQLMAHMKSGGKTPPMLEQIAPPQEMASAAAPGKERITGRVTLDPKLKGKYNPGDTLFVLARAAQGPKMPLAIMRMQVSDLPLDFALDDSMSMAPQMKLSNFDEVVVVGRISKSGTAMPQDGDAEGFSVTVKPGTKNVKLKINHVVGTPMEEQEAAPAASGAPAERITGRVTLDPKLKGKFGPDDTLFVLARAAQGPRMPLAIMRMRVADLPLDFSLDDSMAMAPQMKLSNFDEVVVVGRISRAGTAMPQSGDGEGFSATVKPGSKGVKLKIDHLVE